MKVYDEMSEYYDLIYGDKTDAEFYLREAKNARGPVLEIGCGTGRILLSLLEAGIDAVGIDTSKNMLDILKKKAMGKNLKPVVYQADMLHFSIDRKFRLIILPYRTFMHLKTPDERKSALMNFKKHLEKGGRLILHLYNPSNDDLDMVDSFHHFESEELECSSGLKYRLDWYLHYEPAGRLAHYKIVLTLQDGKELIYPMNISFVPIRDTDALLRQSGYTNIRSYCGFNYGPYYDDCREVVFIAEA